MFLRFYSLDLLTVISSQITAAIEGTGLGNLFGNDHLHRKNCLNQCILNGNDRDYHFKTDPQIFSHNYIFPSGVFRELDWCLV